MFSISDNQVLLQRLSRPQGKIKMVLDTDTYNEIDDQYALAYAALSGDRLDLQAVYAAPFANAHADTPAEGMEKSYEEILRVLSLLERPDLAGKVFKGSTGYLENETTPRHSAAAADLIERANALEEGELLYVAAIGCITNIASALLICPAIKDRIVVVWLGGNAHSWPNTMEFNLSQDIAAARVVFDSGVPLVQLPCMGVVSHLSTTEPELRHYLKGKKGIGDYLYSITCKKAEFDHMGRCWSRIIWDISTIAWLNGLENAMVEELVHTPIVTYDNTYSFTSQRHLMNYISMVNRDVVFDDLFRKLSGE